MGKYYYETKKLGEKNATKICRKYHLGYNPRATHVPHHKPIYVDPMRLPETCKSIVNVIVNIIKRFKK